MSLTSYRAAPPRDKAIARLSRKPVTKRLEAGGQSAPIDPVD
jgi:hypothetical protein